MGDFNFKEIDWVNQATTLSEDHMSTLFLENVRDNYFFNMSQNVLDLERIIYLHYWILFLK